MFILQVGWGTRVRRTALMLCLSAMFVCAVSSSAAAEGVFTPASDAGPAQYAYAPPKSPAPVVVMLSGSTGPDKYKDYAERLAKIGYYVILIAGADIMTRDQDGAANLRKTISRAQQSPLAVKGKGAIVSFSLGGGGSLAYATSMTQQVSVIVAHYPFTNFAGAKDPDSFVKRLKVPLLVLAAERDNYKNCCLIGNIRAIETAAKRSGADFQLVVYPRANHGFNLEGPTHRQEDDRDAWKRALETLRKYQPPHAG